MTLFIPLVTNLEPYFEVSFAAIPEDVQTLVEDRHSLLFNSWDSLPPNERRQIAEQADDQEHPRTEIGMYAALYFLQNDVKGWIDEADRDKKNAAVNYLSKVKDQIDKIMGSNREQVQRAIEQLLPKQASKQEPRRREDTDLHIIGALLGLLLPSQSQDRDKAVFPSKAKLIEALVSQYKGYSGISESNLQRVFPDAERSLQEF